MKSEVIAGLDIGGTNCRIGLVDSRLNIHNEVILKTESLVKKGFISELEKQIMILAGKSERDCCLKGIAMGLPSTIDYKRKVVLQSPNIKGLDNLHIVEIMEKRTGVPVYIERDVNLLLLYDIEAMRLPKDAIIIGVYYGTGIGNAIYMHGKIYRGAHGIAGEIGHVPQLYSRKMCGCGNPSCIEPIGGGRKLTELCNSVFKGTKIEDIYRYHRDTPEIQEQINAMAVTAAGEINILDPEYVILGGGILGMRNFPFDLFEQRLKAHTRKPEPYASLKLCYSDGKPENGIIGAGLLGWTLFTQDSIAEAAAPKAAFARV